MLLYADEDFAFPVVEELRRRGHDVITAQEDGRRNVPDSVVLGRADLLGRAVLTYNCSDFERLHRQGATHSGILSATHDTDFPALASRIHNTLAGALSGPLVYTGQQTLQTVMVHGRSWLAQRPNGRSDLPIGMFRINRFGTPGAAPSRWP